MSLFLKIIIFSLCVIQRSFTAETPFERVVSLGSFCQTKHQLNRYLNEDMTGGGQIFDWCNIYDYKLLGDAIANDLDDIFEKKDLEPYHWETWHSPIYSVINTKYKVGFSHHFTPEYTPNPAYMDEAINTQYDSVKSKVDYLKKKFLDLTNKRVLYVIFNYQFSMFIQKNAPFNGEVLSHLVQGIKACRGNDNFSLLIVDYNETPSTFKMHDIDIFSETITLPPEAVQTLNWSGYSKGWREILSKYIPGIRPSLDEEKEEEAIQSFLATLVKPLPEEVKPLPGKVSSPSVKKATYKKHTKQYKKSKKKDIQKLKILRKKRRLAQQTQQKRRINNQVAQKQVYQKASRQKKKRSSIR